MVLNLETEAGLLFMTPQIHSWHIQKVIDEAVEQFKEQLFVYKKMKVIILKIY